MKLSLFTISHSFEIENYKIESFIERGSAKISAFSLYVSNKEYAENAIIKSTGNKNEYKISFENDYIILKDTSIESIVNTLASTFEYYNEWEKKLYSNLIDDLPLQSLLETAHTMFERPMFISGDSSWVYAITFGYDSVTHPYWNELTQSYNKKIADFNPIKTVSLDPEFQSIFKEKDPIIRHSPLYNAPILYSNIWVEGKRICEVVILEYDKPFSESDIHILQTFCDIIQLYILKHKDSFFEYQGLSFFFANLLKGDSYKLSSYELARNMSGWPEEDPIVIVAFKPKHPSETPLIGVLRDILINNIEECNVFSHNNLIISLINVRANNSYDSLVAKITKIIPAYASNWGISYEFSDFVDFIKYYKQALEALEYAIENNTLFSTMYDISYDSILNKFTNDYDLSSYIHPAILKLKKYDKDNGTELLQSLFVFLLCGENYTDAALELQIHRNTLIYRMNNIQKIVEMDLSNMGTRKLLLLSLFVSD